MALQLTLVAGPGSSSACACANAFRAGEARPCDRATRALIAVAIGVAIVLAVVSASRGATAGAYRAAGLIVMWLGLAIRVWAVAALGRAFRTTVEVDAGQAVVFTGPYKWVRHPPTPGCS